MTADEPRLISQSEAEALLATIAEQLLTPDAVLGLDVDPVVFTHGGAQVYDAIAGDDVEILDWPARIVRGDVMVDGTLRQSAGMAPLLVFGSVTARHVVSDGYLVVMGDLRVSGCFHGSSSNYGTHVFGEVHIDTLLLEKNHEFVPHRKAEIRVRVEDEVDGIGAVQRYLAEMLLP